MLCKPVSMQSTPPEDMWTPQAVIDPIQGTGMTPKTSQEVELTPEPTPETGMTPELPLRIELTPETFPGTAMTLKCTPETGVTTEPRLVEMTPGLTAVATLGQDSRHRIEQSHQICTFALSLHQQIVLSLPCTLLGTDKAGLPTNSLTGVLTAQSPQGESIPLCVKGRIAALTTTLTRQKTARNA